MNYKTFSDEGFVIGRKSFKEADRILTLFTKTHGKITVIAKGVRKLTSRKRGGIEIFTKIKFSAIYSKNAFDILTEVQVLNSSNFKTDLKKVSIAFYFCEVINKITQDEESRSDVFEILDKYFKELENSINLKKLRLAFVKEILVSLGFWPEAQRMDNPDMVLENIIERKINSFRVGRKMLQKD